MPVWVAAELVGIATGESGERWSDAADSLAISRTLGLLGAKGMAVRRTQQAGIAAISCPNRGHRRPLYRLMDWTRG